MTQDFVLIKIDDGKADSYNYFKKFYSNEKNIISLYDSAGLASEALKVEGYPTEFIINKKGELVSELSGFNENGEEKFYTQKTINKINQLLNE